MMLLLRCELLFGILLTLMISGQLHNATAQEASPPAVPDAEQTQPPPIVPKPALKSPRATLQTFLQAMKRDDMEQAIACLDLSYLTSNVAEVSGPNIAHQLKAGLDHLVGIKTDSPDWIWEDVPDENDFAQSYSLDLISVADQSAGDLVLMRGEDANWRFSEDTCRAAEEIYSKVEQLPALADGEQSDEHMPFPMRLRQWFPAGLRQSHFLIPDFQWICLLVLIFVGLAADVLTRNVFTWAVDRWFKKQSEGQSVDSTEKVWRPMGRLANAAIWYLGTKLIGLPSVALNILLIILKLYTIVAAVWTAFALIDMSGKYWSKRALLTETRFDDLLVPLVVKTLKVFVICLGLLTAAQTFDLPVMGLIGGLGLGGAALALASKDAVANFFGSVTVLFDRPFEVGDWIITDGAEGTVESVGFRSTRIRTFYNSMVTLPNSLLTTSVVDNMGRRRYRRIKTTLGVQYDTTPEQIDAFCEGIRELIRQHPYTRKDYYHVYFNDFGPSSLNILLYCFVACPDWAIELRERHRLLADILRLAKELDVQFAFPTRTLHMFTEEDNGPPPEISAPMERGKHLAEKIVSSDGRKITGPVEF